MTKALSVALAVVATTLACRPHQVATTPAPQELVVLLPDPDGGSPGHATVTGSSSTVDLVSARQATEVAAGRPPTAPATIDDARIQQMFDGALSALPPPPRSFNLPFDADELTDAGRAVLTELLQLVRNRPAPDIFIIGHTDTIGTATSNYQLGLQRATRVRDLLVAAGLDSTLITIMSVGEAELLIPTPDETREPRNRRVEVAVR